MNGPFADVPAGEEEPEVRVEVADGDASAEPAAVEV
jgi:hypothetical protein